jgi:hypothetical protein
MMQEVSELSGVSDLWVGGEYGAYLGAAAMLSDNVIKEDRGWWHHGGYRIGWVCYQIVHVATDRWQHYLFGWKTWWKDRQNMTIRHSHRSLKHKELLKIHEQRTARWLAADTWFALYHNDTHQSSLDDSYCILRLCGYTSCWPWSLIAWRCMEFCLSGHCSFTGRYNIQQNKMRRK